MSKREGTRNKFTVDADAVVFAVDFNHELENVLSVNAIRQWASSVDHADRKQQCQILFE